MNKSIRNGECLKKYIVQDVTGKGSYFGTAFFAGARPKNLATVGTIATVTPSRMGSVNFVITQDIANVPTGEESCC